MATLANWSGKSHAALVKRFKDKTGEPWMGQDSMSPYGAYWIRKHGAARVWDNAPDNIAAEARHGNAAAADAAFRAAAHVVTLDLVNQRVAPCPIEPRALLAVYDSQSDRITITASSQMPAGFRDTLAVEVLGIPAESVRVLVGDVGGGFGMKTGLYPEDAVIA